jgi:cytochrome b561
MVTLMNTEERYGVISIVLHWSMALLLFALLLLGFYMVNLPDAGFDMRKIRLILLHKEIGIFAFLLAIVRVIWRSSNALPILNVSIPFWQKVAARFVHLVFYACMLGLPLTGWWMSSAKGIPVSFFGWFALPDILAYDENLFQLLVDIHRWLGFTMVALILLHAGAALRHHLILKDGTLRKMLPM